MTYLIEPKPSYSDKEVINHLKKMGIRNITIKGPRCICAELTFEQVGDLKDIAYCQQELQE